MVTDTSFIFQLHTLAKEANEATGSGEGDLAIFPKKVICARNAELHDVLFTHSDKAASTETDPVEYQAAKEKWDRENKGYVDVGNASIEEFAEWIVDELNKKSHIKAIGAVFGASEYSIDIDLACCNLFLLHSPLFSIHLSFP